MVAPVHVDGRLTALQTVTRWSQPTIVTATQFYIRHNKTTFKFSYDCQPVTKWYILFVACVIGIRVKALVFVPDRAVSMRMIFSFTC